MISIITWVVSGIALLGTVLNAEQKRVGFWLWLFTNLFWVFYDFKIGAYAQSGLFFVYAILAVRGLIAWKQKESR